MKFMALAFAIATIGSVSASQACDAEKALKEYYGTESLKVQPLGLGLVQVVYSSDDHPGATCRGTAYVNASCQVSPRGSYCNYDRN